MKYFFDIAFGEINETHLYGNWSIEDRFINKNKHEAIFLNCEIISFLENGIFKAPSCDAVEGSWSILREIEMIYNPQLLFYYQDKQIAKAIITRLFTDKSISKLTLYFSTGLELNLKKDGVGEISKKQ